MSRDNESLFSNSDLLDSARLQERQFEVTFRGVRGQLQRRIALLQIMSLDKSDIVISEDAWAGFHNSGLDGEAYVLALRNSKVALCPPGHLNNESFRYYEALICGALPLEDKVALSHLGVCPARPKRSEESGVIARISLVREHLSVSKAQLLQSLSFLHE